MNLLKLVCSRTTKEIAEADKYSTLAPTRAQ